MPIRTSIATLAALGALAVPASAAAQPPDWALGTASPRVAYAEERQSFYDARRAAFDEGYREGLKQGERDARRGDRFWYEDQRTYRRADKGYHRSYGDRGRYQVAFRNGYASGYSDAYNRLARGTYRGDRGRYEDRRYGTGYPGGIYGRPGYGSRYGSPAVEHGLREGYEKGREDARKNRSFDPRRHSWYRSGDRHYNGRYGSRDLYKEEYRRAFQQGYDRGYSEGRYR
jgi:hypothetical protein